MHTAWHFLALSPDAGSPSPPAIASGPPRFSLFTLFIFLSFSFEQRRKQKREIVWIFQFSFFVVFVLLNFRLELAIRLFFLPFWISNLLMNEWEWRETRKLARDEQYGNHIANSEVLYSLLEALTKMSLCGWLNFFFLNQSLWLEWILFQIFGIGVSIIDP